MRSVRPTIVIVNRSNGLVSDSNALRIIHAIQRQVSGEFAKAWGADAVISYLRANGRQLPQPLAWQVVLLQNADQPDALGYHDLTPQGAPLAKVFCQDAIESGEDVSVVISHEILEMLCDPKLNGFEHHAGTGLLYAREVCDAVEGSEHGYMNSGIKVSNFVLPAYYHDGATGPFDQCRQLKAPFEILPGGYLPALDPATNKWTDVGMADAQVKPGTRLERRLRAYSERLASSEGSTRVPVGPPPKPVAKVPKQNPLRASHPQRALQPKAPAHAPPIHQPHRGGIKSDRQGGAAPLRQPLRGHRAASAELGVEAPRVAPTGPVPGDRDSFIVPPAVDRPADRPPPVRQPLRGARAQHPETEAAPAAVLEAPAATPASASPAAADDAANTAAPETEKK